MGGKDRSDSGSGLKLEPHGEWKLLKASNKEADRVSMV